MKFCLPSEVIFHSGFALEKYDLTSSGKQTFISPYNNGHKCIIANAIIRHLYTIDRIFFERKDETIL